MSTYFPSIMAHFKFMDGNGKTFPPSTIVRKYKKKYDSMTPEEFERDEHYPEQGVCSTVFTDGYETRKDALTRFMGTDHPFRTGDENATWDSMLHNMRDFAVYG